MNKPTHVIKQNGAGINLESLMDMLASEDGLTRKKARELLADLGKPAVLSLTYVLRNSKIDQLRWEAAKTLGSIDDTRAIPALIKALEDKDQDVAWLASVALKKFKQAAWPQLLSVLIKSKSDSALLRRGAHHILQDQNADGFNELLTTLTKALEPGMAPESTAIAAYNILSQMKGKS
jgi:HEAT repeat protein